MQGLPFRLEAHTECMIRSTLNGVLPVDVEARCVRALATVGERVDDDYPAREGRLHCFVAASRLRVRAILTDVPHVQLLGSTSAQQLERETTVHEQLTRVELAGRKVDSLELDRLAHHEVAHEIGGVAIGISLRRPPC